MIYDVKGRRTVLALVAAIAVSLSAPAAGSAQTPLPVGEADGVRIERRDGIVVVFTKDATRLWKRVAGRRVSVECVELPPEDDRGITSTDSGTTTFRAPKRGRRLRTGDMTRGIDYCRVFLPRRVVRRGRDRTVIGPRLLVSIPLTQQGAVYLDEQEKAFTLMGVLLFAELVAEERDETTLPTYEELVAGRGERVRRVVVPLASPADTPPARRVGYYSDGDQHVAVVMLSASGRRLFIDVSAGDVLYTNVAGYTFDDLD